MIPISEPNLTDVERRHLLAAYDSSWISSRGYYVDRFEAEFADRCGAGSALTVANGTVAVHLALLAMDVQPGDEVLVPSLTYVATANAIRYCGAVPVCVDASESDWCLDIDAAAAAITGRTVGILSADVYGHPCDGRRMRALADAHHLWWVSDSAEAVFASRDGEVVGGAADVTTFSFFGNKVISCGEGGAVTTNSDYTAARMRVLKNQGNSPDRRYHHDVLGYNYRLTNLQAAVLVGQLERSQELLDARTAVVDRYEKAFGELSRVGLQPVVESVRRSPWMACAVLEGAERQERDEVLRRLAAGGVDSRPFFVPMQQMAHLREVARGHSPVADRLSATGLNLPTYPGLTEAQLDTVIEAFAAAVREVLG